MYAVINRDKNLLVRTCNTKEAALIAAQLEKDKLPVAARKAITAVVLDDEGYADILF